MPTISEEFWHVSVAPITAAQLEASGHPTKAHAKTAIREHLRRQGMQPTYRFALSREDEAEAQLDRLRAALRPLPFVASMGRAFSMSL